jgi:hypothetical protein
MVMKFLADTKIAIYQLQKPLAEQLPDGGHFLLKSG